MRRAEVQPEVGRRAAAIDSVDPPGCAGGTRRARRVLAAVPVFLVAGCLSNVGQPSIWPPDDFHVEVRGIVTDTDGTRQTQSFQVWADGLAVYRESDTVVVGESLSLPVWSRASAYRLDPNSTRTLGRLLGRAGLFEDEQLYQDNRHLGGENVAVSWTAFERHGELSTMAGTSNSLDRAIHIVNSFLPDGHEFRYGDLAGEKEPRHVSGAPEPVDSLDGARRCHRELCGLRPDDVALRLDLFTLALSTDELDEAARCLRAIEGAEPNGSLVGASEIPDWDRDFLEPLRQLLRDREARRGSGPRGAAGSSIR